MSVTAPATAVERSFRERNKWLVLRRTTQFSILFLFLLGPWFGIWWLKGNLASSVFLDTVSLTDPFILLQSLASGHVVGQSAVIGAVTIFVFYFLVGGRVYCSWVCPVNIVTDGANWLRNRLKLNLSWSVKKSTRIWIMLMALAVSAVTGTIAWRR